MLELVSYIFSGQDKGRGYFPLFGIGETIPEYFFQVYQESLGEDGRGQNKEVSLLQPGEGLGGM